MQKFVTCLWFDGNAEEAAQYYTSIFKDSKIGDDIQRYGEGAPFPAGTAITVSFSLDGQDFMALNGGPEFKFSEAISIYVHCESQAEVDELWSKLTADGGKESKCGWLKDKYGLSWQIIPEALPRLLHDEDPEKARRVMEAMFQMQKIDVPALDRAYAGT